MNSSMMCISYDIPNCNASMRIIKLNDNKTHIMTIMEEPFH